MGQHSSGLDLVACLSAAQAAVDAAQAVVMHHFGRRDLSVEIKGDGSPVSEADEAAEVAVRAVLAARTPQIPVLGEEHGDDNPDAPLRWVVDPIDGTVSFVHGLPLFGTLLALHDAERDEVLVGVLALPALGERYAAARGRGCTRNGESVRIQPREPGGRQVISAGDPAQFTAARVLPEYHTLLDAHPHVRGYTDAFGHALAIRGGVDAMVDPGLKPWDLMATRCLIVEAGGLVLRRPSKQGAPVEDAIFGRAPSVRAVAALLGWGEGVIAEGRG